MQIVALGYKVPSALHDDSDVLGFASDILGNGPAARLHKLLVDTGKASEVFAFGQTGYAPGLQMFGAVVKKGDPIEPVRAAMTAAVEDFARNPATPEELERVRRNITNDIEKSLNDPQRVGVALSEAIALGDWRLFFVGRERIATISAEDVAQRAGPLPAARQPGDRLLHAGRRAAARRDPAGAERGEPAEGLQAAAPHRWCRKTSSRARTTS